ncbi:hypothetical protein B296_00020017 [Ensete ventricosum]|uniref:holo-[acyl-carrier-protein] synthase n=1 Tax=Ensete ventricosum TaxID=4639 RepID=A0A426Y2P6_ENSVE|nr:hypothetical protein B296_00020017 [Ensete ventricosum]
MGILFSRIFITLIHVGGGSLLVGGLEMKNGVRRWLINVSQWNPSEAQFATVISLFPVDEQTAITRSLLIYSYDIIPAISHVLLFYGNQHAQFHKVGPVHLLTSNLNIDRYIKFEDKKRALVSRLLQYSLVHEVLGTPFDKIIIHRTAEGKPYLINTIDFPISNFNFNVSHHGDYVGIASEPLCLVGLDIVSITTPKQETELEFINNFSPYLTALEWKNVSHAGSSEEMLAEFYRYMNFEFDHHYDSIKKSQKRTPILHSHASLFAGYAG